MGRSRSIHWLDVTHLFVLVPSAKSAPPSASRRNAAAGIPTESKVTSTAPVSPLRRGESLANKPEPPSSPLHGQRWWAETPAVPRPHLGRQWAAPHHLLCLGVEFHYCSGWLTSPPRISRRFPPGSTPPPPGGYHNIVSTHFLRPPSQQRKWESLIHQVRICKVPGSNLCSKDSISECPVCAGGACCGAWASVYNRCNNCSNPEGTGLGGGGGTTGPGSSRLSKDSNWCGTGCVAVTAATTRSSVMPFDASTV